jgi:hypothetical protein
MALIRRKNLANGLTLAMQLALHFLLINVEVILFVKKTIDNLKKLSLA